MTSRLYWIEGLDGYNKQSGKTPGLEQVMKRKKKNSNGQQYGCFESCQFRPRSIFFLTFDPQLKKI
jgi:hypothetical protein